MLGAGFSCAYSSAAPTMGDFLKKALENGIYKPDGPHQQLSEIAQKYFGSPTEANIESVASFLALEATPTLASTKENRATAYKQLIEIIVWTVRDIYDKPRSPEVKKLFSAFSGAVVDRNISLITLNYDLLIDQLLTDTGNWLPVFGYGVELPLAGFLRNDPRLRDVIHPAHGQRLSETVLLKLHGSLNWGRRNVRYSDGSQPVELGHVSSSRILPIQNLGASKAGQPGTFRWDTFIVPPFVSKSSISGTEPVLENVWYHAWAALASANFIHFLGYSLPPSDFQMDILLREGFHTWPAELKKKKVIVVDRDERVRERIATQLKGVEIDTSRSDIEAYLKELIDL